MKIVHLFWVALLLCCCTQKPIAKDIEEKLSGLFDGADFSIKKKTIKEGELYSIIYEIVVSNSRLENKLEAYEICSMSSLILFENKHKEMEFDSIKVRFKNLDFRCSYDNYELDKVHSGLYVFSSFLNGVAYENTDSIMSVSSKYLLTKISAEAIISGVTQAGYNSVEVKGIVFKGFQFVNSIDEFDEVLLLEGDIEYLNRNNIIHVRAFLDLEEMKIIKFEM
jgi:hypothetical protein